MAYLSMRHQMPDKILLLQVPLLSSIMHPSPYKNKAVKSHQNTKCETIYKLDNQPNLLKKMMNEEQ